MYFELHIAITLYHTHFLFFSGSPFRDEISLAVLQLQENNRLEILKRRWWEGGQCPKEEDHRAKGLTFRTLNLSIIPYTLHSMMSNCFLIINSGLGSVNNNCVFGVSVQINAIYTNVFSTNISDG